MVAAVQNKRPGAVDPQNLDGSAIAATVSPKFQAARRIHDRNATHVMIENAKMISAANNACCGAPIDSTAKNTAPTAPRPAALAICAVVPYIPEPAPAEAGLTLASTKLGSGAITNPWP